MSQTQSLPELSIAPAAPPAFVPKPLYMTAIYMTAGLLISITQGLSLNLVNVNIGQIQGSLGATTNEANWMIAAYMAPNVSLSVILLKVRFQYGLRNFAGISIAGFVIAWLLNLLAVSDLNTAILVRFMSGIAASPISSLAFLYMLEPFPPERKIAFGFPLALNNTLFGAPIARLISPTLLETGGWQQISIFELALALIAFCLIRLLPLTPPPRVKVIEPLDVISYAFIAIGFGSVAVVLVLGRLYWWLEAPWIGVLLAIGIACTVVAVIIELNRQKPFIDIRWLINPSVLYATAILLAFRMILAEQSSLMPGLFQVLGLLNDQQRTLYAIVILATICGSLSCVLLYRPGREQPIHLVALCLLFAGAWMDGHSTSITRPTDMFLSQAMIAFGAALFLPAAAGPILTAALVRGPVFMLNFVVIFLTTQSIGGLLGSAFFGTFVTIREKFHSNILAESMTLADPLVVQRIQQLGGAYAGTITDSTLRTAEGAAQLSALVTREANVLAYNDAFLLIAAIAAVAILLLLVHMIAGIVWRRIARSKTST